MSTAARIRVSAVAIGALVSFGLTAVDAEAVQLPFKPVADAHVSKVKKKANYGRSKRLVVSPQVTAYLKFNVRGLPGSVSFASLQLVAFNSSLSSVVVRRAGANRWRENAIRFNNAPKKFAGPTIRARRVKQFRVTSVDVTKLVRGNGVVTLVVMARGRGGASFASGEEKAAILRPLLIVGVNEAPACRAVSFGTNEDTAETATPDCTDSEKDPMSYAIVSQGNQGTASIADGKLRYVPRPDANGADTFQYRASDGRKWSKPVAATVRITAVNDAPVCHNVGLAMDEDAGNAIHANCSDVDNDPLFVTVMAVAANGKSWEVGNELRYQPNPNFHGVDSFTYRAKDTTLGSAPATVSVTVRPINDAPTCAPVAFPTDEDAPREWDPACSDIDGDPLGYGISAHGSKGSASIAGGKLRYAPNLNLNGGDTFMYAASDGSVWSAPAAASVDIIPVNDTPVCSDVALVTDEEVLGEQDPACTDFDGDPLSYAIVTNGQKGNASVGASKLRYLPNVNALGADSFTYQATDGTLTSAPATVSVTIRPGNDVPVCVNVPLNVGEDTPGERDPSCTDVDGDPLTYEIVDQGAKGTASVVGGRLRFAPNPNVFGSDSFTYRALDGTTAGAPATVSVSIAAVNDAPTCSPLPLDIAEDTSGEANPICSDIEGDPLTFSIVSQGTRGVASVAAGKLRYVPLLNVNGGDTFTYRAHDALTSSAATTVSVTIGAVNDAPACSPVTLTTNEDTQAERDPVCSDVEGDTLSYSIFGQGAKGAASVVAGRLRYVPDANANGADSFTYRATDGVANSAAATTSVSIAAVNDAPVCSAVALNIAQDLIGTVAPSCTDVELARGETTTPLTYSIATQGAKGVASVVGSNLVYDPNPGATGSDSFTYTARDGALTSAAAPVNVTIGDVNDPPSCLTRTLTVAEDGFGTVSPSCSDPENDPLTYSIPVNGQGAKGTASVVGGQLRYDASLNATGSDTFSYVARDGALTSAPATVTVTITPVNDAPVCSDVALSTSEDSPNEQNPSCTDVDGNPLTYSIVAGGTKGTASVAAGRLRFVPTANLNGADSFTYRANDGTVNSNVSTVSVTITPVNDAPTCSAVSLTTNEDVPGEADPVCSDIENDPLTYSIVAPAPTKGSASVTGPGKLRFAPNLNATGADSFGYRAFDGSALSGSANVAVSITAVNDAPVCADVPLTTNEDTPGERDPSCSDVEGNSLTYSIVAPATRGTASVVVATGRLRYVPGANVNGLDSFSYRANDGSADSNIAAVAVTIGAVNDAPTCANVPLPTNEDVPGEANPNCSDIDGDSLSYSIVTQGTKGTASVVVASGRLRYAPDQNVNGADSFTYRASDPGNLSSAAATASVSIAAVNDAPVCQAVSKELDEDSNITISPSCTDVEGSPLTYSIRTQPSQGTASVEGSLLRYIALPNASGGDSFTYDASDGAATSAPATVTVTVAAVNDPPVCQARTLLLDEDATFGSATPVCTDPEGDPMTFSIPANGQGTKGTAAVVGGQLRYTPNLNANGADSFTYVASDGPLTSVPATVSVTITPVNDAPACSAVTLTTNEDAPGERDPSCSDVDGDALNYSIVAQGNKGTASVVTGKLRYVPSANANGADSFTYRASDGTLNSTAASAAVTITPVNDAPTCQPLPLATNEDTPAEINPSCSDIDGDALTYSIATQGTKGTASIAAGRLRYVPAANQNGADSFTYQANDPSTSSAPATVSVTITAVNDAPSCVDRSLALAEDSTAGVAPLCSDVEGDPISFAVVAPPTKGSAAVVAGELRYTPNLNANGPDSFTYRANDGFLNGSPANVAVTITAVNDAPVCSNVNLVTGEDSQGETDPSCSDVDGNPLTYSIVAQGPKGTASVSPAGRLRYSPNLNVNGADTFTYSASDGSLLSAPANAAVTIQPVNDAPVCVGVPLATNEDTPGETDPSCSDVDTGTTLTYSIAAQGAKGTASVVVATNKLRFVPTLNANGGDTFTYQASDGLLSSTAAAVSVSIAPVNDAPACANVAFATDEDVSADADPVCTDIDGGVLTYSIVAAPSIGSASVVASRLRYTPNPNSHSSDSFTYRATDAGGLDSPAATATVTINAVNDAPSCSPVTLLTTEDAVGETNPSCSDVDGDALTYSIASQGSIGTASVVAGKLSYTPNLNVTGTDSFTYRATDGGALSSGPATVSVTIGPANDAPACSNVSLGTLEDTMAERDPSCTDIDNDPLTYSIETQGTKGSASVVGNKLRYVPNLNANGADSFTYKAHDGVRFSAPATVTVSITAVNDRPVCADIGLVTNEEVAGERDPSCTDVDGQALTVSIFGQGTKGTASMAGTRLRYVPRLNENGADTFTYRADDGQQISAAATVSVEILPINDVPQCTDVSFAATEDVLSEGDPSCTDIDGNPLTYSVVLAPSRGTASVAGNKLRYLSNLNLNGADSFTYRANDGTVFSNSATASVSVAAVNDAPACAPLTLNGNEDAMAEISPSCSDVEGNPITVSVASQGQKGTASLVAGKLRYVPQTNTNGADSFTYRASDSLLDGAPATVSVNVAPVNDAPVCSSVSFTTDEDVAAERDPACSDIDGDPLTYSIFSQGTKGSATVGGGKLRYAPSLNLNGPDTFMYRAHDASTASAAAPANVTINAINDAPACPAQSLTIDEDSEGTVTPVCTDPENDPVTLEIAGPPLTGSASVVGSSLRYVGSPNVNGLTSFTYRARDTSSAASAAATVSVTIRPVNDAPVCTNVTLSTAEDALGTADPVCTEIDAGDTLSYAIVGQATRGQASVLGTQLRYAPNANLNGADSFTYKANDGVADSNAATVSVSVSPVNDAPTAQNQSSSTSEDTAKALVLSATDIDGDGLSYSIITAPANGVLSGTGANRTYTPNANYFGPDSFTFRVNDGLADSNIATVSLTVTAVNDAPVAQDLSVSTPEDTARAVSLTATDVEGSALTFTIVSGPTSGVLSGTGANRTYTPGPNFNGSDSFTFRANDGAADSNIATVSITVDPVNDAPSCPVQSLTISEDSEGSVTPTCIDAEGNTITLEIVSQGTKGVATVVGSSLRYVANPNLNGADSFTYRGTDGITPGAAATVSVTITPVNDAPTCSDVTLAATEDTMVERDPACADIDSGSLTYSIVAQGAKGVASVVAGKLRYVPNANEVGNDSFTYQASDGPASSAPATVSVTIGSANDAPTAQGLSVSTPEDTAKALTLAATDVEGDPLTYSIVSGPTHGTVSAGTGADRTYTPNANHHGSDSFTYRANDGVANSNVATVTITVTPVNDAPVAADLSASTPEDTAKALTLAGSDVDGNPLTYTIVSGPTHGAISSGTGASRTYTPAANYNGPDSFTYKVNDGSVDSNTATVTLTVDPVNDAPTCSGVSLATNEDAAVEGDPVCTDIEGHALTYTIVTPAGKGTASVVGGRLRYVPNANTNGADSFTYRASDTAAGAPATVSVDVTPVNDAPVCPAQSLTIDEDGSGTVTPFCTDLEGNPITLEIVDQGLRGSASVVGGSLHYVANPGVTGSDSFTYRPRDAGLPGAPATVSVTISAVNDPPSCVDLTVATDEDVPVERDPSCTDVDSSSLTYSIASQGAKGSASVTAGGRLRYVPNANATGDDSFTYRAHDGGVFSAPATVTVSIAAINDAPTCANISLTTNEDVPGERDPACTDVDSGSLTYTVTDGTLGSATVGAGKLRYAPNANVSGADTFTYRATDGAGAQSSPANVSVTIVPVNDAPVAQGLSASTNEDTAKALTLAANDVDPGAALTYVIVAGPTHGTLSGGTGANRTYTPAANYSGPDSFTYKANDGALDSNVATVSLTVDPVNDAPACSAASLTIDEDSEGSVTPSCSDPEGSALSLEIATPGTKGTASVVGSSLRYVADPNKNGSDSFTFRANDGTTAGSPATASVTITPINDAPTCSDVAITTTEDVVGETDPVCTDVDGGTLTYSIVAQGSSGNASVVNNKLQYTPNPNTTGGDTFTYQAHDGSTASAAATVTVTINPANDPPLCSGVTMATVEDTAAAVDPACTDADGPSALSYSIVLPGEKGSASIVDGKLRYVPAANATGTDSFGYVASDGTSSSATATVSVEIAPVNDAPVCADLTLTTTEDVAAERDPACTDVDTATLTYSIVASGALGAASVAAGRLRYVPGANLSGSDSFTYEANDGLATSAPATVSVSIAAANDAPVAEDLSASTPEDTAKALTLAGSDVDGDPVGFAIVSGPAHGSLSGTGAERTYTPDANYHGSDSFTYRANDGAVDSGVATVTLTVTPVNDAPAAGDLSASTPEDTTKALTLAASDVDGDSLAVTIVDAPTHGTLSGTGAERTYTPAANYHGPDSFSYQANDGSVDSNVATVTLTVDPVNDAPSCAPVSLATDEDLAVDGDPVCADIEGNALTYSIVSQPANGTASVVGGKLRYVPAANATGADSFTYRASDAANGAPATVSVTITPVNDAPACAPASLTVDEDGERTVAPSCVDPEGDPISLEVVDQGLKGSASVVGANLRYAPAANLNGSDSFTFRASDGATGAPAVASVTITPVNDAPACVGVDLATDEDAPVERDPSCTDIDGDPLTYSIASDGAKGSASVSAGRLRYTPNANANGTDTFTYQANDNATSSAAATVTVTINPLNDAPTCAGITLTTDEDTIAVRDPSCADADGDALTYSIVANGAKGSASVVADKLRYAPNPNEVGGDSFTYQASDGAASSAAAAVAVTITSANDAPTCADVTLATNEDTPAERDPSCADSDGGALTYSIVSQPAKGAASIVDEKLRYVPSANATGDDSFTYQASDGGAASAPATVAVTITAVNDSPVAGDLSVSTPEDTAKALQLAASDAEGDPVGFSIVSGPTHGALSGTGADRTYTPDANYHGADSFTYRANDGTADSNVATVTLTVTPVNDAPVAQDLSASTPEDTATDVTLAASDLDGDPVAFTIVSSPAHGTLSGTGATRTYTPAANYSGSDSFTYKASDAGLDSNVATVNLAVDAVNDAPVCPAQTLDLNEDASADLTPVCTDVEGDSLSLEIVDQGLKGAASVIGASLRYAGAPNAHGTDTFTYRATDGTASGAPVSVSVTIASVNDAPACANAALATDEDIVGDADPVCNDVDGDALSYSIAAQPSAGTASVVDSKLRYAPNANVNGGDSFTYQASDGTASSPVATTSVTIRPVNDAPSCAALTLTTTEDVLGERDPSCTDIDGDTLTYSIGTQGSIGSASVAGGKLRYLSNPNANGSDTFSYVADDGLAASAANVAVTITPANDAPTCADASLVTDEDVAGVRDPACTDVDGDSLTYSIIADGAKGTASVVAGKLRYVPDPNVNGPDNFTYRALDSTTISGIATVSVTITPVNDAPTCADVALATDEDTPADGDPSCTDIDGGDQTYSIVSQGTKGVASVVDGKLRYAPALNATGADSFTYRASDPAPSAPATVTVTIAGVNDAPICASVTLATDEDAQGTASPACVDPEGDPVTVEIVDPAAQGSASVVSNSLRYLPNANVTGSDSFTYRGSDGVLWGTPATVSVTINPVNDAPVCGPVDLATDEDVAGEGDPACTDIDSGSLTYTIASAASKGDASVAGNRLRYLPNLNATGADSFTYQASDGSATSSAATVSVTITGVNDAPTCADVALAVTEDTPTERDPSCTDVDGASLTYEIVADGAKGSASIVGGKLRYAPNLNATGTDTFTYRASDGALTSGPATVNVTIAAANDAPTCADVALTITEDQPGERDPSCADIDGDGLSYTIVDQATKGTAAVVNGKLRYAPNANATGSDSFTYRAGDGTATSAPATVSITIDPVNDAPSCADVELTTEEGMPAERDPSCTDPENNTLTYSIVAQGTKGTASVVAGKLRYAPNAGETGSDSFTYRASDGLESAPATVSVTIVGTNDPPTCANVSLTTTEDTMAERDPSCSDPEANPLTYEIASQGTKGTATVANGKLRYVPSANATGNDSFTYRASDATLSSASATVSVSITAVNDAPLCPSPVMTIDEDTDGAITPVCVDPEGDAVSLTIVDPQPVNGSAGVFGAEVRYVPLVNAHGVDAIKYRGSDGQLTGPIATISVVINPVNDEPEAIPVDTTTPKGVAKVVTVAGFDYDLGDVVSVRLISLPANGVVRAGPNATDPVINSGQLPFTLTGDQIRYEPTAGFTGLNVFEFIAHDGIAPSLPAEIRINVLGANVAPVCTSRSLTIEEDSELWDTGICSDADGDPLTFTRTGPTRGQLTVFEDASFNYVPDANFNGTDSFTISARDPSGLTSAVVTVTITITPVNDAPTCRPFTMQTTQNTPVVTFADCEDVDENPLTYAIVSQGTKGTASVEPDNRLRYVPNTGATGADSFTFTVSDGVVTSAPQTAQVSIAP